MLLQQLLVCIVIALQKKLIRLPMLRSFSARNAQISFALPAVLVEFHPKVSRNSNVLEYPLLAPRCRHISNDTTESPLNRSTELLSTYYMGPKIEIKLNLHQTYLTLLYLSKTSTKNSHLSSQICGWSTFSRNT